MIKSMLADATNTAMNITNHGQTLQQLLKKSLDHQSQFPISRSASKKNSHVEELEHEEGNYVERSTTFTIVLNRDDSSRWFYDTSQSTYMGHKAESTVGCKVLPVCDAGSTGSNSGDGSGSDIGSEKDENAQKSERRKAFQRMKELLAAAARTPKRASIKGWKALHVRRNATEKAQLDDSTSSSSCTATSYLVSNNLFRLSATSQQSTEIGTNALRDGRWITTDDDFLVLEL